MSRPVGFLLEQCLSPVPGGTGRYARELAGALAATAPHGMRVRGLVAWHRDATAAVVPGVAGPARLPLPRRALAAGWLTGAGPRPRGVSLVHAPTLLFPPRGGRPLVVTIHDAVPWTHPETLTGRGVRWHRRMAARAARTADLLVVPTRAVRDELARRLPIGERTLVVGEGVPARLVVPPDADARAARLGLPTGGYLAMVGTLEPRKGLDVLLAALARRSAPALPLFVAGPTGWGRPVAVALAERLGLSRRVHLLGRLDDPDLAVLTARATASVLPSRAEGFGLPLLEAMHLGTPVVASDVPALVEVAGGAALCVPVGDPQALADALSRVAGDAALRESLSRAGRLRAGAYSWEAAARTLWAAYVGLLTPRA